MPPGFAGTLRLVPNSSPKELLDYDVTSGWKIKAEKGISLQQLNNQDWIRTREFADLAGVTVRALHHYDRLGLLKAKRRSSAGYRLYQLKDLERIEQIIALKFLGLPLAKIRSVLDRDPLSLEQALSRQKAALLEKRNLLDRALTAISEAERARDQGKPVTALLRGIIRTIEMQNDPNWMMKYYSPEAQAKISERARTFTPQMQAEISEAWRNYYRDLARLAGEEDPGGLKAVELANRHRELLAAFTGNDPEVEAGLKALYKDQANWPQGFRDQMKEYGG